jgi:hypothetical protein
MTRSLQTRPSPYASRRPPENLIDERFNVRGRACPHRSKRDRTVSGFQFSEEASAVFAEN